MARLFSRGPGRLWAYTMWQGIIKLLFFYLLFRFLVILLRPVYKAFSGSRRRDFSRSESRRSRAAQEKKPTIIDAEYKDIE